MKANITLNDELFRKLDEEAEKMFMSRSGFIAMCVSNYFDMKQVQKSMSELPDILAKIETLKNSMNDK